MTPQRQTVSIGAGVWRGRRLLYPKGARIRPSMQRTRLSLFSSLGERMDGEVFADLFAGAGAVGIEALSRGARHAHFVERDPGALSALRSNLEALGAEADRFSVHAAGVAVVLDATPCPIADATVVFADPPYDVDIAAELIGHFRARAFPSLRRLVIEHRAKSPLASPTRMTLDRERRFGDTVLSHFVPSADGR